MLQDLISDRQSFFEASARVIADDPEKLENKIGGEYRKLAGELGELLNNAEQEVIFVSPYYVPGEAGIELMRALEDKSIRAGVADHC